MEAIKNRTFIGAFLFGIGIIGMLDGIVFHQLLQWHSVFMHTDRYHQIVSDGMFHLAVTAIIFSSASFLWKSDPQHRHHRPRVFWGAFLLGAGLFNFIEGIINHHVLGIHHVRPGPNQLLYDLAFDASGLLLIGVGAVLVIAHVRGKG